MKDENTQRFAASLSEADDLIELYEDSIEENLKYSNYDVGKDLSKDSAKDGGRRHSYTAANAAGALATSALGLGVIPGMVIGTGVTAIRNHMEYKKNKKAIRDFINGDETASQLQHEITIEGEKSHPDTQKIEKLKQQIYDIIKEKDPAILKEAEDPKEDVNDNVKRKLSYDENHRSADMPIADDDSINEAVLWLYNNGHEITEDNVIWAKRLLEATKPQEKPAMEEVPVEQQPEEVVDPNAIPVDPNMQQEVMASKQISVLPTGDITIDTPNAAVVAAANGTVNLQMAESFIASRDMNRIVKAILIEDCKLSEEDVDSLGSTGQNEMISNIIMTYLKGITDKLSEIDTTTADRSKGDIKNVKELPDIQKAITQIEELINRSEDSTADQANAIKIIISAIRNINQYSAVFKEAYRNKKTVMIMKYQSLILSIISSISYLLSTIVDVSDGDIKLKRNDEELMDFRPLKALDDFNKSVDNGMFKKMVNDTSTLREYYLEVPVSTMSKVLEAADYSSMVSNGLQNIYNGIVNNPKITQVLYKLANFVVLLMSVRDSIYPLVKMKSSVSSMVDAISNFANANGGNGNALSKVSKFASQFKNDADLGNEIANREIDDENRKLSSDARAIRQSDYQPLASTTSTQSTTSSSSNDLFGGF